MEQTKSHRRIVLIDDDALTNMINTKFISMCFEVSIVSHTRAQAALDQFNADPGSGPPAIPDFIFLDINMPGMDGWEFLTEFQKLPADKIKACKVYMVTSSIDLDDIEKTKSFPSVLGFISKPLTRENLTILDE